MGLKELSTAVMGEWKAWQALSNFNKSPILILRNALCFLQRP